MVGEDDGDGALLFDAADGSGGSDFDGLELLDEEKMALNMIAKY